MEEQLAFQIIFQCILWGVGLIFLFRYIWQKQTGRDKPKNSIRKDKPLLPFSEDDDKLEIT